MGAFKINHENYKQFFMVFKNKILKKIKSQF
ncbi:hypothetical protein MSSD1_90 [Mycoplasmopsis synoviae]